MNTIKYFRSQVRYNRRVRFVIFCCEFCSKNFVEYRAFFSHRSICTKNWRCKYSLLYFDESSIVYPLLILVTQQDWLSGFAFVRRSIQVCYSDIIKCTFLCLYKPLAFTSSRASSSVLADLRSDSSPVIGYRFGSMVTSLHTSDRWAASKCLKLSWRACTKPPFLQSIAWLGLKGFPQMHLLGIPGINLSYLRAKASPLLHASETVRNWECERCW